MLPSENVLRNVDSPALLVEIGNATITFWNMFFQEYLRAMSADYRRFWLDPYFEKHTGKKPPGYYFRLARVEPRR
ncbi:MAG: hypothetical protein WBK28_02210 [Minisyncoccia bacterium]